MKARLKSSRLDAVFVITKMNMKFVILRVTGMSEIQFRERERGNVTVAGTNVKNVNTDPIVNKR